MDFNYETLPRQGINQDELLNRLHDLAAGDLDISSMKTWSLVYYLGEEHSRFLQQAYGQFFSANGLNPTVFKGLKKLESQVVRITANLLGGDRDVVGTLTSGGTESCLLAVLAYRELARLKKKIKHPEMILPETAHVAWEKGAHYFGVKSVYVPLDGTFGVDPHAVKKRLSKNTIMILGSAPEYPHGIIDPIRELGRIALENNIPLHVDACVGGFLLPFIEKLGRPVPEWDFRVPGVTSISADIHKYGFSAKGASLILYRNIELMTHQMFVHENWPGGIFASPALLGTRPGGAYAAAWAALLSQGETGYLTMAEKTLEAFEKLIYGIDSIDELDIIGKPMAGLFAYRSNTGTVNIYAVADQMEKKGWKIDRLQKPEALHAMVTPLHLNVTDRYIEDLKDSVAYVRQHPELSRKGGAAMYQMAASFPIRGIIKNAVLKEFAGMYAPGGKIPDPSDPDLFKNSNNKKIDAASLAGRLFLKLRELFKK